MPASSALLEAPPVLASCDTLEDLMERLGVSAGRIRLHPWPGRATAAAVVELQERQGVLCELVSGVLVEKIVGSRQSRLALYLAGLLMAHVIPRNLGFLLGPDGMVQLAEDLIRLPDIAFFHWDRVPEGVAPDDPVIRFAPDLAIEVLSLSNTAREMALKRDEYFAAGVRLVWEIDPEARNVTVYTSPTNARVLSGDDSLDGGDVLPEFHLRVAGIFAELDRRR